MKKLQGIKIIQSKYCDADWRATLQDSHEVFFSQIREFSQRRDVDLYNLCGVYHTANVPFKIHDIDYESYAQYAPCEGITRAFSDAVFQGISTGNAVLVAGGYCNFAPAIAGGLQRAIGTDKKIGIIWIDAHTDNQRVEDYEEPVRLVAVPLSTITGQTLPSYRRHICGLEKPIDGQNILVTDARDTYEDEERNLKNAQIYRLSCEEFDHCDVFKSAVDKIADRVDAIYLSVDADILRADYIPAYAYEVSGGHSIETVMRNISSVMNTGKVCVFSVGCIDFDRYEQGGEYTYLSGMKLIASGLQHWKYTAL